MAGTDAGPGENYAMNQHPTSTEMGRGRGPAPSPAPHPQKQNLAVYTKVWTHLGNSHRRGHADYFSFLVVSFLSASIVTTTSAPGLRATFWPSSCFRTLLLRIS